MRKTVKDREKGNSEMRRGEEIEREAGKQTYVGSDGHRKTENALSKLLQVKTSARIYKLFKNYLCSFTNC